MSRRPPCPNPICRSACRIPWHRRKRPRQKGPSALPRPCGTTSGVARRRPARGRLQSRATECHRPDGCRPFARVAVRAREPNPLRPARGRKRRYGQHRHHRRRHLPLRLRQRRLYMPCRLRPRPARRGQTRNFEKQSDQRRQELRPQVDGRIDPDRSATAADQYAAPGGYQVSGTSVAGARGPGHRARRR